MDKTIKYLFLVILSFSFASGSYAQKFRHLKKGKVIRTEIEAAPDKIAEDPFAIVIPDSLPLINPDSLADDPVISAHYLNFPPRVMSPIVFRGYQNLDNSKANLTLGKYLITDTVNRPVVSSPIPQWLRVAMRAEELTSRNQYEYMIAHPGQIEYAYWDLPLPPKVPEEDRSYAGYLRRLNLPQIELNGTTIKEGDRDKRHWLHYFNTGLQFSQAFVSTNWYQGGTNYLSMLFNFTWNVDLNGVYHPNVLFQSALNYKLAFTSTPKGSLHSYSISQDMLQYNLKGGIKAFNNWFYSLTMQIKTPIFKTYPADSEKLQSSFLSQGTFNFGLGMTYTHINEKKTFNFGLSVAPISYNLKTCINNNIDPTQFGIKAGRKTASEIGSNLEANMRWQIAPNVRWSSRFFVFSDYKYFMGEWENTFDFAFSKLFSVQLYLHPRYDTSSDFNSSKWHYWMLKEILSVGLSYTFSTKG